MHLIELDAHFLLLGCDNCQFFILIENVVHDFTLILLTCEIESSSIIILKSFVLFGYQK